MAEVQSHGFDFENWVKQKFFADFDASYSSKWDIPKEFNDLEIVPENLRNLPVSVKTCKYDSPIGFGDALRKFNVDEDFLLIVGFWEQSGEHKNFIAVEAVKVSVKSWKKMFEPLNEEELSYLDSIIKNREINYVEVRQKAKEIKKSFPPTKIIINPKIDSKIQRRLQCSLPFKTFWQYFVGKEPYKNINCSLFGEKVPNPFSSKQREFKKKSVPE